MKDMSKTLMSIGQNGYFNIYSKIIEIMDHCDELSTANCITYMKAGIETLSKNIPGEVCHNIISRGRIEQTEYGGQVLQTGDVHPVLPRLPTQGHRAPT